MRTVLLITIALISTSAYSQVRGKLQTTTGEPVASANVVIYLATDSSNVAGTSSDDAGLFEFANIAAGTYYCRISSIGYISAFTDSFMVPAYASPIILPTMILTEEDATLNEVVVSARKDLVRVTPNGKIFNIQSSLQTKGSNALQVLERLPGVITDRRNNQFTLNGSAGITVLFNGRRVLLSMDELMNLLESTVADNIERIELLTSPGSRYDADGSGGIINIVFKKSENEGTRLNVSATAGYGYREKAVATATLSHGFRKGSINVSYSFMHDVGRAGFAGYGTNDGLMYDGTTFANFSGIAKSFRNTHNLNLAGEIQASAKHVFGADFVFSSNGTHNLWNNEVAWEFDNGEYLRYAALSDGKSKRNNVIASVYSRHTLSGKSQLNADASFLSYVNNSPALIDAKYFDRAGNPVVPGDSVYTSGNRGTSTSNLYAFSFSLDYSTRLSKKLTAEIGSKVSVSDNSNDSKIETLIGEEWQTDSRSQSLINSAEKIAAVYGQIRYTPNAKSNLQAGLRYEYWQRDINIYKDPFTIGKLFPSLLYSYTFRNNNIMSVSYSRRISRPAYTDLVSNLFYNDPTFVFSGNPLLKPTLTDVVKADFTRKSLNVGLSYQFDRDPVLRYQIVSNETKEIGVASPQNLDYQQSLNLNLNYSLQPASWMRLSAGSTTSLRRYKVSYSLHPAEKTFVFQNINFSGHVQLPHQFEVELAGWYNFPFYEGTNSLKGFGIMNLGIGKKLKKERGSFQLAFPDLFRSFSVHTHISGMTPIAFNINTHTNWRDESSRYRIIKLTYSRTFGKSSISAAKRNKQIEEAERM